MRRSLVLALAALISLVASTASAQWYLGMRTAGYYMEASIEQEICRYVEVDADGVFNYCEAVLGYSFDAFDGELSFGYNTYSATYEAPEERSPYDWEGDLSVYTFGMTGLYHIVPADPVSLDGGLRFQLHSIDAEYTQSNRDYTETDDTGGWSFGPVVRARWFFADGALAFGPELYLKYTSWSHEIGWGSDRDESEEIEHSDFGTEYSVRLDWFF